MGSLVYMYNKELHRDFPWSVNALRKPFRENLILKQLGHVGLISWKEPKS